MSNTTTAPRTVQGAREWIEAVMADGTTLAECAAQIGALEALDAHAAEGLANLRVALAVLEAEATRPARITREHCSGMWEVVDTATGDTVGLYADRKSADRVAARV